MATKRKEARLLGYEIMFNRKGQLITQRTTTDITKLKDTLNIKDFSLLQSVIRSGTRELDEVHNKIEAELNSRKG
tara:strand:+ start:429 stop:653 length:225 start_codon:yes stop_codon:yes gene_type:complete